MKFQIANALISTTFALNDYQVNEAVNAIEAVKENVGVGSIAQALSIIQDAWKNADKNSVSDEEAEEYIVEKFGESHGFRNACEGDNCQTGTLELDALFGYGCWCFFGRIDSALGRGPPVDAYDATCQKLALCYRCIFVDSENEGDAECDPFQTTFTATVSLNSILGGGAAENATTSCKTENQDNCSWRTCSCAMTMITNFFNLSFDTNAVYDDNLKHSEGFDYNLECPQQGKALDRQCCGFYPQRRTFDRKESRECCHDISIYNPLRHVCCDDGTHIGLGHSC